MFPEPTLFFKVIQKGEIRRSKLIQQYQRMMTQTHKKSFNFNRIRDQIKEEDPNIETLTLKENRTNNKILFSVKFKKPIYYCQIELLGKQISLKLQKELLENLKKTDKTIIRKCINKDILVEKR